MSGNINGVQAKIKQHYPNANYVHFYAHQLNLVMDNAASINRNVQIFFLLALEVFVHFFQRLLKELLFWMKLFKNVYLKQLIQDGIFILEQ
jgi:hypothetical protein